MSDLNSLNLLLLYGSGKQRYCRWFIRERALKMPTHLVVNNFTGSNGWFDIFKRRHKIVYRILADESRRFDSETLDDWTNARFLQEIKEYDLCDVMLMRWVYFSVYN
jgi:hypothetical protein